MREAPAQVELRTPVPEQHAATPIRRTFPLRLSFARRSATPLRRHAGTPIRFPSGGGVRFSEDKELHEDKGDQSRWRNCEKLGDQNVVRDRGEAEIDNRDRRQPRGEDDREVLHKLPSIITAPASKHPEFVQQKMAGHTDKVGN
jgi:hypothetical protein